jgi:hypothetical protein
MISRLREGKLNVLAIAFRKPCRKLDIGVAGMEIPQTSESAVALGTGGRSIGSRCVGFRTQMYI